MASLRHFVLAWLVDVLIAAPTATHATRAELTTTVTLNANATDRVLQGEMYTSERERPRQPSEVSAVDVLLRLCPNLNQTQMQNGRNLLVQCPFERFFGDCFNAERVPEVLDAATLSNGWNPAAGPRPHDIPDGDALFADNEWTRFEFGLNGRRNGYITHFSDSCSICQSSIYYNAVRVLQAVESRPFMLRFHRSAYEEFIGSRAPVSEPIGGYRNRWQRYVRSGARLGAPEELVLHTFLGGSSTISFNTRKPGFFFFYTLESASRGRVLVVVDSEPPACCATSS